MSAEAHPPVGVAHIGRSGVWRLWEGTTMSDYECCASGSCEVCRRPTGYTQRQREETQDYEPPWMRQHDREGWNR